MSEAPLPTPVPARPLLPWLTFGVLLGALAPLALSAAAGRCGVQLGATAWCWLLGLPLTALVAWLSEARWPWLRRVLLFALGCLLGAQLAEVPPALGDGPRLVSATGTVGAMARPGYRQAFQLRTSEAKLWVEGPALPALASGDEVLVRGLWRRGQRGFEIDATELERLVPRESGVRGWAFRAVDRLGPRRELAAGLLLGAGSPPEKGDFKRAGLLHVLAVSGAHLGIAAALAWWLLRLAGCPWLPRLLLLTGLVLGYLWLTGGAPATQRAAAMTVAVVASSLLARQPHPLGVVALAALLLMLIDPAIVDDLGFQFSLAAVLGITTLGSELQRLRERWLPLRPWPLDRGSWRALLFSLRTAIDGLAIGASATLAVAPLLAWHLHQLNPWSAISSVLVAPACAGALWLGLPCLLLAGAWPDGPWSGLYAALDGCLEALARGVEWAATWRGATMAAITPPVLTAVLWPLLFVRWPWAWQAGARVALGVGLAWWWMLG